MPGLNFSIKAPWQYVILHNTDHRYTYPTRIIDSLSSGDKTIFFETLTEICSENVIYQHYYCGKQNPFGPNKLKITGKLHCRC